MYFSGNIEKIQKKKNVKFWKTIQNLLENFSKIAKKFQ